MTCSETAVRAQTGLQRTLRSSAAKQELEEEVALEKAEEKLMQHGDDDDDDDEEIHSCDESGKPVVDAEKLERRMMTVALVKSVVETSGNAQNANDGDGDDKKHSYGLRKRNLKSSGSDDEDEEPPRQRVRKTQQQPLKKRSVHGSSASAVTMPKQKTTVGPMSQGVQSTQQVPNPLLSSNVNPPQLPHPGAQANVSAAGPVPCPLPASAAKEGRPDAAPSAPVTMKATDTDAAGAARRGRIFSIDIDRKSFACGWLSLCIVFCN